MFFVDQLGPALTPFTAREFGAFVRRKLDGRAATVSPDQLRELVAEFMALFNIRTSTDSVIDFLARNGAVTFQGPTQTQAAKFELAA